jgi:hypothetical protein
LIESALNSNLAGILRRHLTRLAYQTLIRETRLISAAHLVQPRGSSAAPHVRSGSPWLLPTLGSSRRTLRMLNVCMKSRGFDVQLQVTVFPYFISLCLHLIQRNEIPCRHAIEDCSHLARPGTFAQPATRTSCRRLDKNFSREEQRTGYTWDLNSDRTWGSTLGWFSRHYCSKHIKYTRRPLLLSAVAITPTAWAD